MADSVFKLRNAFGEPAMMNKTLITLAVLAASTSAFAQSSVTLYGTLDAGVGKYHGSKVRMSTGWHPLGYSVNTSDSFIGFRGIEDLGGGLKAGFQFEQAVNLRDGSSDEQSVVADQATYQRAANVWLGGNWGTFRMGRAYSPSRNATAVWDVSEMANNSIIYARFGAPCATAASSATKRPTSVALPPNWATCSRPTTAVTPRWTWA